MNELSSYLRRTLCEAWRNGYGEEARRAAIVAPLLTLVGFAAAWFFPQLTDHVMGVLEQAIDSAGLSSPTASLSCPRSCSSARQGCTSARA